MFREVVNNNSLCVFSIILFSCVIHFSLAIEPSYFTKNDWKFQKEAIITNGDFVKDIIWNDPSVMRDEATGKYRMWLSGGTGVGLNNVEVYHAWSADGISGWSINSTPIVTFSRNAGDWDDEKIETPSVIKVKETYHLYYSGSKTEYINGNRIIRYQIGHATSTDGINFQKDANNPVIKYQMDDMAKFGYYAVAEPAAVYYPPEDAIYVFYTCIKMRSGSLPFFSTNNKVYGICAQKSQTGSTLGSLFATVETNHTSSPHVPILTQTTNYPVSKNYMGYSTPMAWISNSTTPNSIHLMYDVVVDPPGRFNEFQQVALSHAIVLMGGQRPLCAMEVTPDIIKIGEGDIDWNKVEIRAPSVIEENGQWKLWYAGHSYLSFTSWKVGIGYGVSNVRNFTDSFPKLQCNPYVEEFGFQVDVLVLSVVLLVVAAFCCFFLCPCGGFICCFIPLLLSIVWTFFAL